MCFLVVLPRPPLSKVKIVPGNSEIKEVLNTITIQMGPRVMLAAKIKLNGDLNIDQAVDVINALEGALKSRHPEIGWCFIEPDNRD